MSTYKWKLTLKTLLSDDDILHEQVEIIEYNNNKGTYGINFRY